jgi:membrane-associated phospholipid phosphatase
MAAPKAAALPLGYSPMRLEIQQQDAGKTHFVNNTGVKLRCVVLLILIGTPGYGGEIKETAGAVGRELRRYGRDARSLTAAPLHWDAQQWRKAGLVTLGFAAVIAMDEEIQEIVQRNRSDFTGEVADFVTPWGGQRAQWVSVGMLVSASVVGDDRLRDTGRDALEAYLFAGRITTPLLKRAIGRSRPFEADSTYDFDPFSGHSSLPSGHATSAFAVASVIGDRYRHRPWIRGFAYGLASAVAYARVHDNVHYASDVVAGAIIGMGIGRGIVARNRDVPVSREVRVEPFLLEDGFGIKFTVRLGESAR